MKFKSLFKETSTLNSLISLSGSTFVVKLLNLLIIGYPARILGPENYGLISFSLSVVAYFSILILPGIQNWGLRNIAKSSSVSSETFSVVVSIRFLLATISYILVILFCQYFVKSNPERIVLMICALTLFTNALGLDWVFNGLGLIKINAFLLIIQSLLNITLLFSFVKTENDIYDYIIITPLLNFIIFSIGLLILKRKSIKFVFPSFNFIKSSIKDSYILGVSISLIIVLHYANNLIIKYYLGNKLLGIFMASFYLFELATTIPGLLTNVFAPKISNYYYSENATYLKKEITFYQKLTFFAAFFIFSAYYFLSNDIIKTIYGTKYLDAIPIIKILSFGVFFNFLISFFTNTIVAIGKDMIMIRIVILSALISIIGGLLLVPIWGINGAAYVIVSIDIVGCLYAIYFFNKIFNNEYKYSKILYSLLIIFLLEFIINLLVTALLMKLIIISIIFLLYFFILFEIKFKKIFF